MSNLVYQPSTCCHKDPNQETNTDYSSYDFKFPIHQQYKTQMVDIFSNGFYLFFPLPTEFALFERATIKVSRTKMMYKLSR